MASASANSFSSALHRLPYLRRLIAAARDDLGATDRPRKRVDRAGLPIVKEGLLAASSIQHPNIAAVLPAGYELAVGCPGHEMYAPQVLLVAPHALPQSGFPSPGRLI